MKKKPITVVKNAHQQSTLTHTNGVAEENWITAVAALHNTDLVASGKSLSAFA